ncbi:putative potassium transporter 12 [Phragmites australis]|uniref:putative potassium transporter 12 n=1 Tax=Phragmites australis TaxID=29695 RepID=UPI002D77F5A5|nr:putative potassium transporter 12 [Phragmites australis]
MGAYGSWIRTLISPWMRRLAGSKTCTEKRWHVCSVFFTLPACKAKVKRWLEGRAYKKNCLLILVLVGTCTAIGDGILTPAISVLSASGGIRVQNQKMSTGQQCYL